MEAEDAVLPLQEISLMHPDECTIDYLEATQSEPQLPQKINQPGRCLENAWQVQAFLSYLASPRYMSNALSSLSLRSDELS